MTEINRKVKEQIVVFHGRDPRNEKQQSGQNGHASLFSGGHGANPGADFAFNPRGILAKRFLLRLSTENISQRKSSFVAWLLFLVDPEHTNRS